MREVDPENTSRAYAFEHWLNAPMPMVTFFKEINVSPLIKYACKYNYRFNMLMCWHIGLAASAIKEFYLLPVGGKLMQYDALAVNAIVKNKTGEVSSCDIPFSESLGEFNKNYLELVGMVAEICQNHDLENHMVIGTSNIADYEIDGAVGMYSGIYNNPFLIWGKYRKYWFKSLLKISFQFHHTQMDGAHAARFLHDLQKNISAIH